MQDTGRKGNKSSFSHQCTGVCWSSSTRAPQLCLHYKRNWAVSQQMLDLVRAAIFRPVLMLTPVSLQAQTLSQPHMLPASQKLTFIELKHQGHVWQRNAAASRWKLKMQLTKREEEGLTIQHSFLFSSYPQADFRNSLKHCFWQRLVWGLGETLNKNTHHPEHSSHLDGPVWLCKIYSNAQQPCDALDGFYPDYPKPQETWMQGLYLFLQLMKLQALTWTSFKVLDQLLHYTVGNTTVWS